MGASAFFAQLTAFRCSGFLFKIESVGPTYLVGAGLPQELPAPRTAFLLARFCLDVISHAATYFDDKVVEVWRFVRPMTSVVILSHHLFCYMCAD
jgi:hypothetical protein